MFDDEYVSLTGRQVKFLMDRFKAPDPDAAVERFVEFLVHQGKDPQDLLKHLAHLMARENN